jgi:hypothetical protein
VKKIRPVRVSWDDSVGHGHWHSSEQVRADPPRPSRIETIGYLLEKKKNSIVLAMSVSEGTNEVMHLLSIPRRAVTSLERLD